MINLASNIMNRLKRKKFYSKLIAKGDLCFDIGANRGVKSKLFLSLGAKVIAFEPQSHCYKTLEAIKKRNPDFEFHDIAVGAVNEKRELLLANYSEIATLSNVFVDRYSSDTVYWNDHETVRVESIDFLIGKYGLPHFCKIDVEGFELAILSHLHYKIPIIEFEFTEKFIEETLEIIDLFESDTTVFNYIMGENPKFELETWVNGSILKDIIVTLPKYRLHGNIFIKALTQ